MQQYVVKKNVEIDERAAEELEVLSAEIQAKFFALFKMLEKDGFLKEPFAKKLERNFLKLE